MSHNDENYGKYGLLRLNYLKEQRPTLYASLLSSGDLPGHLHDVNKRATTEVEQLVDAFVKDADLPDKTTASAEWTQKMNALKHKAEEVVCSQIVYI